MRKSFGRVTGLLWVDPYPMPVSVDTVTYRRYKLFWWFIRIWRFKDTGEGYLVFTRDEEFSSPSAAAAVVHGGHANGLTAWKNKEGKTLKEIEST